MIFLNFRECHFNSSSGVVRSSRPEVFCKKGVPRSFVKLTGKHLCQSLFFNKVAGLGQQLFLTEHLRWLLLSNISQVCKK